MESIDLKPLFENAKIKYKLCPLHVSKNSILNTRRIFSFSLFITKDIQDIRRRMLKNEVISDTDKKKYQSWFDKYMNSQVLKFKELLDNPNWKDFGIVWFLEGTIKELFPDELKEVMNIFKPYTGRIVLFRYVCTDVPNPFYGSVIRYIPLTTGGFDIILFRDAHDTMPNTKNNYDRDWLNTWLKTDKTFWLYQSIIYNPEHARGDRVPYAAAWGAQDREREKRPILSPQTWNEYFGNPSRDIQRGDYGIDERIFADLINNHTEFIDESYIVGITWILYLFVPYANPRTFERVYNNQTNKWFLCKEQRGHSVYIYTYFTEVRCVIYYIAEIYAQGLDTPIGTLWDYIDWLQANLAEISKENQLLFKLINMAPSKAHLWEFLFDVSSLVNETTTLENAIIWFGVGDFDYRNMCNIIPKYFRGGEFNYDKYIDLPGDHIPLPETRIILPPAHPLSIRESRSAN